MGAATTVSSEPTSADGAASAESPNLGVPTKVSTTEAPWKQLHPASLLVNLIPTVWRTVRVSWPLLLAFMAGGGVRGLIDITLILLVFGTAMARTIIHFATLRYRVVEGKLHLRSGLLSRTDRVIDSGRIQNVEIVQNMFHKMAGLVELRVETAGDSGTEGGAEGLLSAISLLEAEALRTQLARPGAPAPGAATGEPIDSASLLEVIAFGVSVGRVGAAAIAVGFVLDATAQVSPGTFQAGSKSLGSVGFAGLALLALAGGYVVSVGNAVLRYFGHRWWRVGDEIQLEAGLFTRRRMDIPIRKVQLVRVQEPILRRFMGYATMLVETAAAGGVPGRGAVEGTVPMVAKEDLTARARVVLPTLDVDVEQRLNPCAPRAVFRAAVGGALRWIFPAWAAAQFVGVPWLWAMVPVAGVLGFLDARKQGWVVSDEFIVVRRGFLRRDTWLLPRGKVQSVHVFQSPIMRRYDLARVIVWIPGGRIALPDIRLAEADQVFAVLATPRPAAAA